MTKIAILGFGTVGSSFAEVLAASGAGVRITHVFNRGVARKKSHERAKFVPADAKWTERVEDVLEAADVDCVVELMGGLDPVKRPCDRGRVGQWISASGTCPVLAGHLSSTLPLRSL